MDAIIGCMKRLLPAFLALAVCVSFGCSSSADKPASTPTKSAEQAKPTPAEQNTDTTAVPSTETDITGTWRSEVPPAQVARFKRSGLAVPKFEITFSKDGRFVAHQEWGDDKKVAEGTYKRHGFSLTLTTEKINGKAPTDKRTQMTHTISPDGTQIATARGERLVRADSK